jgi:hypothetical protein
MPRSSEAHGICKAVRQFATPSLRGSRIFRSATADAENIRIRVYNETTGNPIAILNGDNTGTRTDASGKITTTHNRETLVWVKIQGRWLIVNHQNSPIE